MQHASSRKTNRLTLPADGDTRAHGGDLFEQLGQLQQNTSQNQP